MASLPTLGPQLLVKHKRQLHNAKKNDKHTQIKPNVSEINFPKSNLVMGIVYKIKIQKGYKKTKKNKVEYKKKKNQMEYKGKLTLKPEIVSGSITMNSSTQVPKTQ